MKWRVLVASILLLTILLGCSPKAPVPLPPTQETPPAVTQETPAPTTPTPAPTTMPTPLTYTLTVTAAPSNGGSINLSPAGGTYTRGTRVSLTAIPASGYTFDYWDGAVSGSSYTVTIIMNSNKSTTAHFKATPATIPRPIATGSYTGPLFDTHLHMGNIQNAQVFPNYLQQRKVDWALGFYVFSSDASSTFVRGLTTNGAKSGVIPLLQLRDPKSFGWSQFTSGQFSEEVLRKFLRPHGTLQGAGEIVLYESDLQNVTFDSPIMQTVFKVVNEMKGIVMVHPSNVERGGRPTELSEIEPSVRKYPDAIFLFHGKSVSNLVIQLMAKYPNVYFTMDVLNWIFTTKNLVNYNLLNPEGAAAETAERFLADVSRIGSDRLVEDGLTEALPLLQEYPDRIFWGTDFSKPYHFEDAVTDKVIEITRKFIGKLPADIQEKYAYQNAQRVFGRFLTPNP